MYRHISSTALRAAPDSEHLNIPAVEARMAQLLARSQAEPVLEASVVSEMQQSLLRFSAEKV